MKKLKLFFAALVLLVGWANSASAQVWTAPVVPGNDISATNTGDFVIYNIEADAFMLNGMNWGTQALACRLEGGYTAAPATRYKFTISVDGNTVKMISANYGDKGVGCASANANDVWANYGSNFTWTYSPDAEYGCAYTLYQEGFGTLDVQSRWGGRLTVKDGCGLTKWAFIPTGNLTNGNFAKWKERKAMYDVYKALVASGNDGTYSAALSTAKTTYDKSEASVSDLRAATRALIIATANGIESSTNVSALFTNANLQQEGTADWSATGTTKDAGIVELWHGSIILTQTKTDLPVGQYSLVFRGMTRQDGSDGAPVFKVVSGTNQETADVPFMTDLATQWGVVGCADWVDVGGKIIPDKKWRAAEALAYDFASAKIDNFNVVDPTTTLTVTQSSTSQWFTFNSFEIYYNTPIIASYATALPANGEMLADVWYYFDILSDSEYNLTATALDDIVYTKDGTIVKANMGSVSAKFSGTNPVELTTGRYYIKSSSGNNFAFEANVKTYTVGDVTATSIANNTYLQSLTTVTFTLDNAETNDGTAALAVQGETKAALNDGSSDVAEGTLSIDAKVVTATFTSVTLDPSKTYTITLPANAIAWDKNTANKNSEKVITFKTPAVFDGTYFMASTDGTQFISRGGDSNTEATLDQFGIAINITTNENNVTMLQLIDNERYIFGGSKTIYTDRIASDENVQNYGKWTVNAITGGFSFYNTGYSKFIAAGTGAESGKAAATYAVAAYAWTLVAPATHAALMATYKDANAAEVAAAAGLSATTVAALETILTGADYTLESVTPTNAYATVSEKYQPSGYTEKIIEQEYSGLKNGIYKVKLSAFHRIKTNAATYACSQNNTDNPTSYLYANDQKVQLPSVMSEFRASAYIGGDNPNYEAESGKNYPNNTTAAGTAFDEKKYIVEVFAVVTDGTLKLGLTDPGKYTSATWQYTNWICFKDLEITYYQNNNPVTISENVNYTPVPMAADVTLTRTIKADTWNTFVVPFAISNAELVAKFGADVAVAEYSETADGDNSTVSFTKMATPAVAANTPVLLKTSTAGTSYTFPARSIVVGDAKVAGIHFDFVGNYNASLALVNGDYFISSNKLYKKGESATVTLKGTRAYIQPKTTPVKILNFIIDDEIVTGVGSVEAAEAEEDGVLYNTVGQVVTEDYKGIVIKNGKKYYQK